MNFGGKILEIPTIFITPVRPNLVPRIKSYFEGFGEVESFRLGQVCDTEYGLVRFKTIDAFTMVLERSPHWIAKCFITATDDPLCNVLVPHFESESNIVNALNDDCLRAIFMMLDDFDLANIADVCVRFNHLAKIVYKAKHPDKIVKIFSIHYRNHKFRNGFEQKTATALFRNFGELIEHLQIDNCQFYKMTNQEDFLASALKYLPNLKVLHISHSAWESPLILNQQFAKLQDFRFEFNSSLREYKKCDHNELCNFLIKNPTLKKLKIKSNEKDNSVDMLCSIGQHLHGLEELHIQEIFCCDDLEFQKCAQNLSNLKSLKSLKLHFNFGYIAPVVEALVSENVPIEQLKVIGGTITHDGIQAISKLKQIKVLQIKDIHYFMEEDLDLFKELPLLQELTIGCRTMVFTVEAIQKVVTNAPKLSYFRIHLPADNFVINVNEYESMLKSVQCRLEKIPLVLGIRAYVYSRDHYNVLNLKADILEKNRDSFYIHVTYMSLCYDSN